jgi:hypothetical protein
MPLKTIPVKMEGSGSLGDTMQEHAFSKVRELLNQQRKALTDAISLENSARRIISDMRHVRISAGKPGLASYLG